MPFGTTWMPLCLNVFGTAKKPLVNGFQTTFAATSSLYVPACVNL